MTKNVGGADRIIRMLVGLVLIALATSGTVGWWGYLGLLPLIGGAVGYCPLYSLLKISTCKK